MTTTTTQSTNPCVVGVRCLDSVETNPYDGALLVNHISYGVNADLDAVLAHTAPPVAVTLTSDGRHYDTTMGWHTGPEGEWVRVERWTPLGRVFHGFIDGTSRKLVQAG